jgi:2-C-methyl-D-erythritol 4-phosphate cytidylyltransferase / 2-C-methyl-D-erythritol 2,4-cyclodiphosphate synthase
MNNKPPKIAALVVAAGSGTRFGAASMPKQYQPLLGKPLLRWSLDTLASHPEIDSVHVVIHPDHQDLFTAAAAGTKIRAPILGGATRQESVRLGLDALAAQETPPDFVLIHDAARPCLSAALVSAITSCLQSGDTAVLPGIPVTDTIKRAQENGRVTTEDRNNLYTVQTPQGFNFNMIHALHLQYAAESLTDDAALVEKSSGAIRMVQGDPQNIKVTYADSLSNAAQILAVARQDIRTGKGYDVHRLVPPRHDLDRLIIGGITLPHDKVLDGHSDADVALHAITDALLGTVCNGDIGMHFSPKDERWKGADSADFLRHAAQLICAHDGLITHVDLTVICEAPKIGPHRDAMRARIADILCMPADRISVKATTTEGLGFTGRGEGIAAEAVVTVRLPFKADAFEHQQNASLRRTG